MGEIYLFKRPPLDWQDEEFLYARQEPVKRIVDEWTWLASE
jgi:hypothetical protein